MKEAAMHAIRPAAVAGTFYPGDRDALSREVAGYLAEAHAGRPAPAYPKAIVVPHAGYIYSGAVAAQAYALLRPARGLVKRVVLLGPCHRVAVRGLALPAATAFDTPLGRVPVDAGAVQQLAGLPQVGVSAATHAQEHALEVQLPFLQAVLGEFSLVPLVVGAASADQVAEVLDTLWGGPETLVVISTDLSHYRTYDAARAIDGRTVAAILALDTQLDHEQACGATPLGGFLLTAKRRGLEAELLDARNSGDTAGGRDRVVGYASFAFREPHAARFGDGHGRTLTGIARGAIGEALGRGAAAVPAEHWLREQRASFVTLTLGERLRGCIGSLEAHRPLGEDVAANARSAALRDPRFPPLTAAEFDRVGVEVSVLSSPALLPFGDHDELIAQLRPGIDGLILACDGRRGTFLPQVWEQLPEPETFLAHLKQKAGLPAATRTTRCTVWRYEVLKWREADLRAH
jgi:AmmeMemoRadiSam system protein B/AmmeMemoRadiSam system protein A